MAAKNSHFVEVDVKKSASPTTNPLDSIHDLPAVISQFLAACSVLASPFDIRVGAACLPPRSTVDYQALWQTISHAEVITNEAICKARGLRVIVVW